MYYSKPTIDPNNDKRIWLPGTYIVKSEDGGATFEPEPTSPTYDVGLKTDHHVIRVDPANSSHIYVVGDGGLHESFDMGKTYVRVNNIPVAQAYRIAVDNRDPYWIYLGLQDNHSWMGPSATRHWLGIWVLDDASPIAEWTPAIAAKRSHLFVVPRAPLMLYWEDVSNMDHYFFTAENPVEGAVFTYHLAQPAQKVRLIVTASNGKVIREVTGPGEAGMIHRVNWDLRYPVPRQSRCTKPTRLSRCRSSGPVISSCCDACCFGRAMLIGLCGRTRTEITPCALQCVW